MSYTRKIFVLGVLLLIMLSMVAAPLALAQDATPTTEATVEPTDEAGAADAASTPVTEPAAETTPVVDPEAATTPVVEPAAEQQQAPGTLPQTGAVATPSTSILLVTIGALILIGGLGLALTRRRR